MSRKMRKQDLTHIIDYIREAYMGDSYREYILEGNDPRNHVLYQACLVFDNVEDFEEDIKNFEKNS